MIHIRYLSSYLQFINLLKLRRDFDKSMSPYESQSIPDAMQLPSALHSSTRHWRSSAGQLLAPISLMQSRYSAEPVSTGPGASLVDDGGGATTEEL
jgi:hypothetical protein